MANITCPLCGSPVEQGGVFGQGKPFCARCGWNLARAENSLTANSRVPQIMVAAFAMMAIGLFWVTASAKGGTPLVPVLPILVIFALAGGIPYWSYLSKKRAIAQAKAAPSLQGVQAQPIPDAFLQRIQSLSRPRRVRFGFPGAPVAAVVFGFAMLSGALFFATGRVGPPAGPRDAAPFPYFALFGPIGFVVLILGIVIVPALVKEKRNRPLFQDGEVAAARVLAQRTVRQGKTSYSQIEYEFRTSGSNPALCFGSSGRKVFEDMLIPVFYDPVNP